MAVVPVFTVTTFFLLKWCVSGWQATAKLILSAFQHLDNFLSQCWTISPDITLIEYGPK